MDLALQRDIELFAASKGLKDAAALKAIVWVESAGSIYWNVKGVNLCAIRCEGHYFDRILKKKDLAKWKAARAAGLANPIVGGLKNPSSWAARYALFERMRRIDEDAAIESTSFGVGQVMGANWRELGFKSAVEFMKTCQSSLKGQLEVMWRFIVKKGLIDEIQRKDWAGFAKVYNGPAYARNKYDTNMAKAYKQFSTGAVDSDIVLLQEGLKKLGFYKGKVDGLMGPQTRNAIKAFQNKAGLVVDGIPGTLTMEKLNEFLIAKDSDKNRSIIPPLAGGAVVTTTVVQTGMEIVDAANEATEKAKPLLETLNFSPIVIGVILAVIVVVIVGVYVRRIKGSDQEIMYTLSHDDNGGLPETADGEFDGDGS